MNERRVTLSDIAVKAEVHVTTVSLALRNHPRLPEKTRRRIQALAKKMGYTPDPFLRALVSYRGKMMPHRNPAILAYVTNWHTRWGWKKMTAHPEFYEGAQAKAEELGRFASGLFGSFQNVLIWRLNQLATTWAVSSASRC